jgi:hypothetical protein
MHVPSGSAKYVCPKCRVKIPAADLEQVYASQLRSFVFSPDDIAAHLEQASEEIAGEAARLEGLENERKRVAAEMDKLYSLYLADAISPEGFASRNRPLETRLNQLDETIPELMGALDFRRLQILSSAEIVSEAQDLYSRWPALTREDRRTIIETITDRITFTTEEIHIDLNYIPAGTPSLKEPTTEQRNVTDSSPPPA